jgi:arylsulfatase A-like enzyme
VARLLDLWKQQRPGREFVVILVSDHGEGLGELGQYGHHEGSSKELVHVPLIFNGPGIPSGVQDQPVSLTGLAGTLFEYLDIAPFKLHSRSFLDLVQDEQSDFDPGPAYMQLWTPRRQETYDAIHVGASHLSRTKRDGQTEARLMEWEEGQSRPLEGAQLAEELEQLLEQRYLADRTFRAVHPPRMDQDANNDEMDLIRNLGYMGDE